MNRVTVELGISRLSSELTQHRAAIESLTAKLTGLDEQYAGLCERLDVHGEDVQADIDKLSAQRTDARRQSAEHETAIGDLQRRLQVARLAMAKVEHSEREVELKDLAAHAGVVVSRYHRAAVELAESNDEVRNYQQKMLSLRRQIEDYARSNGLAMPQIEIFGYERFREGYLADSRGLASVRQKFPVED